MATHALLSLDKGNRASSWVWELDPTLKRHTHTNAVHVHVHLQQRWGHIHQCRASYCMHLHLHLLHGSFSYAKPRPCLSGHCSGQGTVKMAPSDTGTIHAATSHMSVGFWRNSVWNFLAVCLPRKYSVRGTGHMSDFCSAFPLGSLKWQFALTLMLIKSFILLQSISSRLMSNSSVIVLGFSLKYNETIYVMYSTHTDKGLTALKEADSTYMWCTKKAEALIHPISVALKQPQNRINSQQLKWWEMRAEIEEKGCVCLQSQN